MLLIVHTLVILAWNIFFPFINFETVEIVNLSPTSSKKIIKYNMNKSVVHSSHRPWEG